MLARLIKVPVKEKVWMRRFRRKKKEHSNGARSSNEIEMCTTA